MKKHHFASTAEAYDASQCDDDIKNGDVLIVASEGVIGVLVNAWPVAIVYPVGDPGSFHTFKDGPSEVKRKFKPSIEAAINVAIEDADITGNEHWKEAAA